MLRFLTGPAWAVVEYGWYPLLLLIATPWFLHQLGPEQYGYWMLLTATVGFGGVLNIGTGAATIKAVSADLGRTSAKGGSAPAIRASIAIALLGGSVLALLVLGLFSAGDGVLLGRMGNSTLVRTTAIFAALLIWLEQIDNVFSSAMKGAEQFGPAARVEMLSKAGQVTSAGLMIFLWPTLLSLYSALLAGAVLRLFAKALVTRKLLGLTNMRPSFTGAHEIFHFAKWGWLQGTGSIMFGVADRLLIGSLLGATSLAYYSIASQLAMQVHAVSAAGLSVIFPNISRRVENGKAFSLARITKLTMSGNFILSTTLALGLIFFGPAILNAWVGAQAGASAGVILPSLVIAYWLLSFNVVPYYVLLGMGRIRLVGLTVLAAGAAGALTVYFAIMEMGIHGTPLGRLGYALVSLFLIFPLVRQITQTRSLGYSTDENAKLAFTLRDSSLS